MSLWKMISKPATFQRETTKRSTEKLEKRKRREGRKPEWELFCRNRNQNTWPRLRTVGWSIRVRKETSTDGFLRVIKNATRRAMYFSLYNNTYKAVRMKQDEKERKSNRRARSRWASPVYVVGRYAKFARDVPHAVVQLSSQMGASCESVQDALRMPS